MNRIMIDIETLDIKPSAIVFQVGALVFNETSNLSEGLYDFDIINQLMIGRTIEENTLEFWKTEPGKPTEAKERAYVKVATAFDDITQMIKAYNVEEVWANSPSFDIVILESLARDFNVKVPWTFRSLRDMRTIKKYFGHAITQPDKKARHNALQDCHDQVIETREMLLAIKGENILVSVPRGVQPQ